MLARALAALLVCVPAFAGERVADVPRLDLGVAPAAGPTAALTAPSLTLPTLAPSAIGAPAPLPGAGLSAAPIGAAQAAPAAAGAAHAEAAPALPEAREAKPLAAEPSKGFDIVLDVDATIIGKTPEGEAADGLPVDGAESVTVAYTTFKGETKTSTYLVRKGFKDFIRRSRADPNVRGIHILSGSNQLRLNAIAAAILIDGKPLSSYVDTLIGGEFLNALSPQDKPDPKRRPIKDLNVYDLKQLKAIDAALRRGDLDAALSLSRERAGAGSSFLDNRRFLVVDDSPEMVRGGKLTQVQGVLAFKPAHKLIPDGADEKTRARMLGMKRALWDHQNGEFGRLADMLDRGLVPGSPEWSAEEKAPFEDRWKKASLP